MRPLTEGCDSIDDFVECGRLVIGWWAVPGFWMSLRRKALESNLISESSHDSTARALCLCLTLFADDASKSTRVRDICVTTLIVLSKIRILLLLD